MNALSWCGTNLGTVGLPGASLLAILLPILLAFAAGCEKTPPPRPVTATTPKAAAMEQGPGEQHQEAVADAVELEPLPAFSADRLEQLVAPVALYPDPLLMEILMAATYPAEVAEAGAWRKQHPSLNGKDLDDAIADQGWDVSVNALTHAPQALELMAADPAWTRDLGDAFLGQQDDVLNAVQLLRSQACDLGTLKTTEQQEVIIDEAPVPPAAAPEVQVVVEPPPRIVRIVPTQPEVVYVPVYNPQVVYGPPPPNVYYPGVVSYPTISASVTPIITFGVGLAIGAILASDCDWHNRRVYSRRYGRGYYGGGYYDRYRDSYRDGYRDGRRDGYRDGHRYDDYSSRAQPWRHDPRHRRDVRYRTEQVAQTYRPSPRTGDRTARDGWDRYPSRDSRDGSRGDRGGFRPGTRDDPRDSVRDGGSRDPRERAREARRNQLRDQARERIRNGMAPGRPGVRPVTAPSSERATRRTPDRKDERSMRPPSPSLGRAAGERRASPPAAAGRESESRRSPGKGVVGQAPRRPSSPKAVDRASGRGGTAPAPTRVTGSARGARSSSSERSSSVRKPPTMSPGRSADRRSPEVSSDRSSGRSSGYVAPSRPSTRSSSPSSRQDRPKMERSRPPAAGQGVRPSRGPSDGRRSSGGSVQRGGSPRKEVSARRDSSPPRVGGSQGGDRRSSGSNRGGISGSPRGDRDKASNGGSRR